MMNFKRTLAITVALMILSANTVYPFDTLRVQIGEESLKRIDEFINSGEGQEFKGRFERLAREAPYHYDLGKWLLIENWRILRRILEGKKIPPTYIEIHPSGKCNFNCRWCKGGYRHKTSKSSHYYMERAMLLNLIEDIHNLNPAALVRFSGFVGEPLENPATIEALKRVSELNMNWGLTTNGLLLTPEICDVVLNASFVNVSLDAGTNMTHSRLKGLRVEDDTFGGILENISYLVRLKREKGGKVRIGVSVLLQPENWREIAGLSRQLKEIGVDILQLKTAHFDPKGLMSPEELSEMYQALQDIQTQDNGKDYTVYIMQEEKEAEEKLKGHYEGPSMQQCYVALVQSAISPDGTVHTCCHYGYGDLGPQGNLKQDNFRELWVSDLRAKVTKRNPIGRCKYCAPADAKFNKLVQLLKDAYEKYPDILDWIERNFVIKDVIGIDNQVSGGAIVNKHL